jgi:hypothetical protein
MNSVFARTGLPCSIVAVALHLNACGPSSDDLYSGPLPERVDFNFHVKPLLSDRCFSCHGPDEAARQASLRLDTPDGARRVIAPGSLRRSKLFRRITSDDPDEVMPPQDSPLKLSDYERALLARWIEQGAEWKQHWSLLPPEKPALPETKDPGAAKYPIDRFVRARLEREGLKPSPEASKETLIRRLSFDLTGLPPTVAEIDAFLADNDPEAYEKVVNRLLASPHYGERLAAEWLDIARYADSHGYQDDGMRNVWPWRDWVIEAFNRNLPYDQFVTWQLAGDLVEQPTQEQILATAFNRQHMQSQEGGIVDEEYRVEYVADRVNTLGRGMLGLTLECARCHDHKYDPIKQKEYYQLFAFFNNINESGTTPYKGEASPLVIVTDEEVTERLAELERQIHGLEQETDPANSKYDLGFKAWRSRLAAGPLPRIEPEGLIARLPLDTMSRDFRLANRAGARRPAVLQGDRDLAPETVAGHFGGAQRFKGETRIELGDSTGFFERNHPFSVSLWIKLERAGVAGPIFSRAGGTFNGYRGYEAWLRPDGSLHARLSHVWPDEAIEVETADRILPGAWHHFAMTYDGSSRAAGIRLYLDGRSLVQRTVTDHLRRSLLHDGNGDNWDGWSRFRIGGENTQTTEDATFDELRLYDRQLTSLEVAALSGTTDPLGRALESNDEAALRAYYVDRVAPGTAHARRRLMALRGEANEILSEQPAVMVLREREVTEPRPTHVLARGAYNAPMESVTAGTPSAVLAFPDDLPRNRLGLARWLIDPENPLFARVAVNRYWQMLFGRGLVRTAEDFGNQGELPTHPELLDYLAIRFRENGWDLKALLKEIVLSATYRQSSIADPALRERDPENVLLARGTSFRLPAEMIRDHALAASGLLVREIGGPSVKPYQPPGLWQQLATRNATEYVQDHGDKLYRRSLYTIWKRTSPPPMMISFDASQRDVCTVRRQSTNTPLQALVLMNDPQFVEAARVLAERMVKEGGKSPDDRIVFGFRALTSRYPDAEELRTLRGLFDAERVAFEKDASAARRLLSTGEHPRDRRLEPAEVAALAVVASTIMNFDETVFRR